MSVATLARFLGKRSAAEAGGRPRLKAEQDPEVVYAIGDVHGCLDALVRLEQKIAADAKSANGEAWLVVLGDMIDRGPDSAQVIDHLLAPPPGGLRRICLAGNHEAMMTTFLAKPSAKSEWLTHGGIETLQSYGLSETAVMEVSGRLLAQLVERHVPADHAAFIAGLPTVFETPRHVFVHAGVRPDVALRMQTDRDLLWYSDKLEASYAGLGKVVVHGHVITPTPFDSPFRIAIDTGAYRTGRLTAVRIDGTGSRTFIEVSKPSPPR